MTIEDFEKQRKRRLLQVFFLTEAMLLIEAVHRFFVDSEQANELSAALLLAGLLLSPVWFLAQREALKFASRWLLIGLTLLVTTLLWAFNGLSDEALLADLDDWLAPLVGRRLDAIAPGKLHEALLVNPYDTGQTAETIQRALHMPLAERQHRHQALLARIRTHDVHAWRAAFLGALANTPASPGGPPA